VLSHEPGRTRTARCLPRHAICRPGKRPVPLTPHGPLPPSGTGGYNWQLVAPKEEGLGVGLADIIKTHLDVGDD
jgi:hypothetical protein